LGAVIVTIYFSAGGLWGSAWINLVQVAVKAVGFTAATAYALSAAGGWEGLTARLQDQAADPQAYTSLLGGGLSGPVSYAVILIPSFIVSPGLIQKLFGARDEGVVRRAVGAQGVCLLVYSFLPVTLGMIAFARWPELANPGLALPKLLAEGLPPMLGGLLLAAIFSAEISSADAVLFMLSTSVARDLGPYFYHHDDDRAQLRLVRWSAAAAGALGAAVALWLQSILAALTIFYSLLTATLFTPLLAGLFWRRPRAGSALAAMAAGPLGALAMHAASSGAGFGVLTPTACGIAVGSAFYLLLSLRRPKSAAIR